MRRSISLLLFTGLAIGLLIPAASSARTLTVHAGKSIQQAVDRGIRETGSSSFPVFIARMGKLVPRSPATVGW